jgi:hypothetical protein
MEFQWPQIAPKVEEILGFHWLAVLHHLRTAIRVKYDNLVTNLLDIQSANAHLADNIITKVRDGVTWRLYESPECSPAAPSSRQHLLENDTVLKMHFRHSQANEPEAHVRKTLGWAFSEPDFAMLIHCDLLMDIWRMTFRLENGQHLTQVGIHMRKSHGRSTSLSLYCRYDIEAWTFVYNLTGSEISAIESQYIPEVCLTKSCQNSTGNAWFLAKPCEVMG